MLRQADVSGDAKAHGTRISLEVNGARHDIVIEPRWLLSDVLREIVGLTGTHVGCEHGICGACTVIVDDRPVRSCLLLGVQADGARVRTVESLAGDDQISRLQELFRKHHALQCGFCTPGFLMLIQGALDREPEISDEDLVHLLSSNICRCTGYAGIIAAAREYLDDLTGRS